MSQMSSAAIDISDLDRLALFQALWEYQASMRITGDESEEYFDSTRAKKLLKNGTYIEYFMGRPIFANLSSKSIWATQYDHYAGSGAMQMIIHLLRESLKGEEIEEKPKSLARYVK